MTKSLKASLKRGPCCPASLLELVQLLAPARALQGAVQAGHQSLVVHRLAEVVEGAELHRLDGQLHVAHAGDHHHRHAGVLLPDVAEHLHPAHHRHVHVQQDQVEAAGGDPVSTARVLSASTSVS